MCVWSYLRKKRIDRLVDFDFFLHGGSHFLKPHAPRGAARSRPPAPQLSLPSGPTSHGSWFPGVRVETWEKKITACGQLVIREVKKKTGTACNRSAFRKSRRQIFFFRHVWAVQVFLEKKRKGRRQIFFSMYRRLTFSWEEKVGRISVAPPFPAACICWTQTTCMTDPTSHPHATMGSTMPSERFTFLTEKKKAASCNVLLVPHATAPCPPPPIAATHDLISYGCMHCAIFLIYFMIFCMHGASV